MSYPPPYPDQPPGTQPHQPPPVYVPPPQYGTPDAPPSQPYPPPSQPYPAPSEPYMPPPGYPTPGYPPPSQPFGVPGYGQPPMYGVPPGLPFMPAPLENNGLATASMILGIIGLVTFWLYGLGVVAAIVGVILGHISLGQIKTVPAGNRGMAIAGLIMSYIAIGLTVLCVGGIVLLGISLAGASTTP